MKIVNTFIMGKQHLKFTKKELRRMEELDSRIDDDSVSIIQEDYQRLAYLAEVKAICEEAFDRAFGDQ